MHEVRKLRELVELAPQRVESLRVAHRPTYHTVEHALHTGLQPPRVEQLLLERIQHLCERVKESCAPVRKQRPQHSVVEHDERMPWMRPRAARLLHQHQELTQFLAEVATVTGQLHWPQTFVDRCCPDKEPLLVGRRVGELVPTVQ